MTRHLVRSSFLCLALLGLAASPAHAICGDGVIDGADVCDDGNLDDDDGCSAGCAIEPPLGRHCELTFSVTNAVEIGHVQFHVDYAGAGQFPGSAGSVHCAGVDGDLHAANDDDAEFRLTLGNINLIGVNAPADFFRCQFDIQSELGENPDAADLPITLEDATDDEGSPVAAVVELTTVSCDTGSSLCQDGILQSWEECDDDNSVEGDGCDSDCAVEPCFECVTTSGPSTCSPQNCDDGDPCTDDSCNADDGCVAVSNGDTCCEMTFRLTSIETLATLQATTDYSAADGDFEGTGDDVECTNLSSALHAHHDADASSDLHLGWVDFAGFTGPLDMARCNYHAAGDSRPAPSDFSITITESTAPGGMGTGASLVLGDITCNTDCPPLPSSGCLEAGASSIVVKDSAEDASDKLIWKWKKGAAFTFAGLGDPTTDGGYRLCLYPDSGAASETIIVSPGALWSAKTDSGYTYNDKEAATGGVSGIKIKAGDAGKTSVQVKARSLALPAGLLPVGTAYTIQLRDTAGGQCWSSAFTGGETKNGQYKAKAP